MSRYDVLSEITEKRIKDDIANNTRSERAHV